MPYPHTWLKTQFLAMRSIDGLLEQLRDQEGMTTSSISEWDGLVKESISLTIKLQGLRQQKQHLNEKIRKFEAEHPDPISEDFKLIRLDRRVRMHNQQYSDLLSRWDQMTLLREMETGGINILKQARVSKSPIKPRKIMTLSFWCSTRSCFRNWYRAIP